MRRSRFAGRTCQPGEFGGRVLALAPHQNKRAESELFEKTVDGVTLGDGFGQIVSEQRKQRVIVLFTEDQCIADATIARPGEAKRQRIVMQGQIRAKDRRERTPQAKAFDHGDAAAGHTPADQNLRARSARRVARRQDQSAGCFASRIDQR